MKAVMLLSVLIGILLSLLIFIGSKYLGTGHVNGVHVQLIERNTDGIIKSMCRNHVEYIMLNGNGSAITIALDQSGKPMSCNY